MPYSLMFDSLASWTRKLCLALILAVASGPYAADAATPSLRGNYNGIVLISQGSSTRISGSAAVAVTGSKKAPKIAISGVINNVTYAQNIKFNAGHIAFVSSLLPGIASFNGPVGGTYRGTTNLTLSAAFFRTSPNANPTPGHLKMTIGKTNSNSTLTINSAVTFEGDTLPIYVTILALR